MKLDKERGYRIRQEYSTVKEKSICDQHNLLQVGGSRTKIDGTNGIDNKSIKNASGVSTQVHLTTQNYFIKKLNLDKNSENFIRLFCGSSQISKNGRDRYQISEIDDTIKKDFENFLNSNKTKIIDYIVRNGFNITHIIFNDIKKDVQYEISYDEILLKIENCTWEFKKGGIHLKNEQGKTYFHLQREGKRNPKNRYNVLWHIHKNLFI